MLGKEKAWYGHFYVPVLDGNNNIPGKHIVRRVGAVAQLTKTAPRNEVQQIIHKHFDELGARPDPTTSPCKNLLRKKVYPNRSADLLNGLRDEEYCNFIAEHVRTYTKAIFDEY